MNFFLYIIQLIFILYYIRVLYKFAWDKLNGAYGTAKNFFSVLFCFFLHILSIYQLLKYVKY
jgi:hypothetical protein